MQFYTTRILRCEAELQARTAAYACLRKKGLRWAAYAVARTSCKLVLDMQERVEQADRAKVRAEQNADALKTQSKVWPPVHYLKLSGSAASVPRL